MAEVLTIIGASAAIMQLLQYGCTLFSSTSALSRRMYRASERVQFWDERSSQMLSLLRTIRENIHTLDPTLSSLVKQCESDANVVRSLISRFHPGNRSQRLSKSKKAMFALFHEKECEARISSFEKTFSIMALSLLILIANANDKTQQIGYAGYQTYLTNSMHLHSPDDLHVINGRSEMALALFLERSLCEAEILFCYVHNERQRILGPSHHETTKSKANVAMTINELGYQDKAEDLYRQALVEFYQGVGPLHPETIKTHHNLATNLHDQKRYKEADQHVVIALSALSSICESSQEEFLEALEFRAILLHCMQMYAAALEIAGHVYETRLISLGYENGATQRVLSHVRDLAENCEEERVMVTFLSSELTSVV